jgi:hypothetical protein
MTNPFDPALIYSGSDAEEPLPILKITETRVDKVRNSLNVLKDVRDEGISEKPVIFAEVFAGDPAGRNRSSAGDELARDEQ